MAKRKKSQRSKVGEMAFKDRNLVPVNPLKEQFDPTEAIPIQPRKRMAGAG